MVKPCGPFLERGTQMTRCVFVSRCHLWQLLQRTISNSFCNTLVSSAVLWPRRESKQNFDWSGTPDSNVAWRRDTSHPIKETRELRGTELLKDLVPSNNFDFTAAPPRSENTQLQVPPTNRCRELAGGWIKAVILCSCLTCKAALTMKKFLLLCFNYCCHNMSPGEHVSHVTCLKNWHRFVRLELNLLNSHSENCYIWANRQLLL